MTILTLDLPPDLYQRLRAEAKQLGKSPQAVAREWLVERLLPQAPIPESDEDLGERALSEAGLLTELGPNLRHLADPTISLEEVQAALSRASGQSLSDIVLEQRRAKDW